MTFGVDEHRGRQTEAAEGASEATVAIQHHVGQDEPLAQEEGSDPLGWLALRGEGEDHVGMGNNRDLEMGQLAPAGAAPGKHRSAAGRPSARPSTSAIPMTASAATSASCDENPPSGMNRRHGTSA
jgi:hypothetical protein